ncbi:hypothetical protein DGMP_31790 [Desulfomarina profundi]|uniref:Uncharacterized protein n=1 Tax=Desulfomarina profundi TaxID=2772557 RepID=A0A8D5FW84_9BACT|nr:hypothetical protein [Desulfomarina profundi]BCL62486.1 hypothetical protein DGMP_31790 [Desulfomarina profundi]
MIRDLALATKATCSLEDQESLVPLVLQLKKLTEVASKQGLLALENELTNIKDPFLNLGYSSLLTKWSPKTSKTSLTLISTTMNQTEENY